MSKTQKHQVKHVTNQYSNFFVGSLSSRNNVRAPINLEEKENPNALKNNFSWKLDLFIVKSVASQLFEQSNETSGVFITLKSTNCLISYFLSSPQCLVGQIQV